MTGFCHGVEVAEIVGRVANVGELPVQNGVDPVVRHQEVMQAVVAMHQSAGGLVIQAGVCPQPLERRLEDG